jgi:beta-lactam-binding protein with PASTA domain/D-alanine-D-alanine ligase-like ATP-grasp enzyme
MKLNIGIIFGGPSRRREQSFRNARSIFTNLDRQLFEPVLIFADCHEQLYSPRWELLYRESLCGLFPDPAAASDPASPFAVYEESLGPTPDASQPGLWGEYFRPVALEALPRHINLAIIAISAYPEAETWVRTALESVHVPYVGTGPAAGQFFGSFAATQRFWADHGFESPSFETISHSAWTQGEPVRYLDAAIHSLGLPIRVFPAADPSNYALIDRMDDISSFREAIDAAFYQERLPIQRWQEMDLFERTEHLRLLTDLHIGLGFPIQVQAGKFQSLVHHPAELFNLLNEYAGNPAFEQTECLLSSALAKGDIVVLQAHPGGKAFTGILSPTREGYQVFAPLGRPERHSRGFQPAAEGVEWSEAVFSATESSAIQDKVGAIIQKTGITQVLGISGSIAPDGKIFFEQVSTGLTFLPDDPLFVAAGQAGKLPVDWLTWIIYHNLRDRIAERPAEISWRGLLEYLEEMIAAKKPSPSVGILFSCTAGRQCLTESAGQIVQFLGAEGSFRPIPLVLESHAEGVPSVRELPPVPLRREGEGRVLPVYPPFSPLPPPFFPAGPFSIDLLSGKTAAIFLDTRAEPVQGQLQKILKACQIGFNGPGPAAATVATHPYHSLEALRRNAQLSVCGQLLLTRASFIANPEAAMQRIESRFLYPLLGVPHNQGGVPLSRREELEALIRLVFRPEGTEGAAFRKILRLKPQQEIPARQELLFQEIVRPRGAINFLALQVPLISKYDTEGNPVFQVCDPEARSGSRILTGAADQETQGLDLLSPETARKVAEEVKKAAETVARVLNLQGAAIVGLSVRVYENTAVEAIVERIEILPEWKLNGPLVRALLRQGRFPGTVLAEIIRDSIARPQLEQLGLAARSEYIYSNTPSIITTPAQPDPNLAAQGQNPTHTMENAPPSPQSGIRELRSRLPATGVAGIVQAWFLNLWNFVSSAIFLKNLAAAVLFIFIFINILSIGLKLYTHHGQAEEVQDYQGMTAREAKRKARANSFTTLVNDSSYIVGKAPGIILDQVPKPGSKIKKNRYIYLTVTSSTPPQVPLPSLVGGNDDFDQYRKKLERLGINARIKDREFNAELADNTILYLVFNGRRIEPGALKRGVKIPKGSSLDVVVSIRNTGTVDIPDLLCMTYEEAIFLLQSSQLTVGSVFAPGEPSPGLYVYKQSPGFNPALKLSVGEGISLYLSEEKPANCRE